jgi:Na+/H+ antiporter NhaD/arsenite permease-like protein
MVLIRPILQTNAQRRYRVHTVVFFILLVSNIGGTLLPIGDPPLFLGYLEGVPFFWTMKALWAPWAVTCGILLVIYYFWDRAAYNREDPKALVRDTTERQPLRLQGWVNLVFLAGIVACVAFVDPKKPFLGTEFTPFPFMRELIMLALVAASLARTPAGVREYNRFDYHAIAEVAALFIGIFITMQIPLQVLEAAGPKITESLNQPWQFFWLTGSLSSFLDNAPTYLVFFRLGQTMDAAGTEVVGLGGDAAISTALLVAISLGAVFMGAMTYIGNGPNFMVKSIAEQAGVRMPSFFGYLFRFSIPILVPVFILVTLVFLLS